jgi:hypothetical protein
VLTSYPRLPLPVARRLFEETRDSLIEELSRRTDVTHPAAEWHPTVPGRVDANTLHGLRDAVLLIAKEYGYPDLQLRGRHRTFDQQVGAALHRLMDIAPAEAAAGGIWSFLALVLMPDVAAWRFPDRKPERMIGTDYLFGANSHVFTRLWARAAVLSEETNNQLGEDEAVALFERSTIGGDPRLARTIADTLVTTGAAHQDLARSKIMRDAMKRVRRLAVFVCFPALDDGPLRLMIKECFNQTVVALRTAPR